MMGRRPRLIVIDYFQILKGERQRGDSRDSELSALMQGLVWTAAEFGCPLLLGSQLNRDVEKRPNKRPQLSDLRESGSIEQDADVVMMLHRDWMAGIETDENGVSTERQADLLGLKWRNGAQFHLKLDFDPQKMKFMEQLNSGLIPVNMNSPEPMDEPEPF